MDNIDIIDPEMELKTLSTVLFRAALIGCKIQHPLTKHSILFASWSIRTFQYLECRKHTLKPWSLATTPLREKEKKKVAEAECHQNEKAQQKSGVRTFPSQGAARPPEGPEKKRPPEIKYGSAWCVPHICPLHMEVGEFPCHRKSPWTLWEVEHNPASARRKRWWRGEVVAPFSLCSAWQGDVNKQRFIYASLVTDITPYGWW